MAASAPRKILRWMVDHLLFDTGGVPRPGLLGFLWSTRKLLIAIVGSAVLTWGEWVEHHPPEIALIAVIHFVFVLAAIALVVLIWRQISRNPEKRQAGQQPKGPAGS